MRLEINTRNILRRAMEAIHVSYILAKNLYTFFYVPRLELVKKIRQRQCEGKKAFRSYGYFWVIFPGLQYELEAKSELKNVSV